MPKDRDRRSTTTPARGTAIAVAIDAGADLVHDDPAPGPEISFDDLTPPPQSERDEIELSAMRIERRTIAIQDRPGPSPAPEAVAAAITIHGVNAELVNLKGELTGVKKVVDGHGSILVGHGTTLASIDARLGGLSNQVTEVVPLLVKEITADRAVRRQQEQMTMTEEHMRSITVIERDGKRALSEVEIESAKEKAELELASARDKAAVDVETARKKARIERLTKAVAVLASVATALLSIHALSKC